MIDETRDWILHLIQNPKTTIAISSGTVATGVTTGLGITPADIGLLVTLLGGLPSVMLSIYWGHRIVISIRKERERIDRLRIREKQGLPIRRNDDHTDSHPT